MAERLGVAVGAVLALAAVAAACGPGETSEHAAHSADAHGAHPSEVDATALITGEFALVDARTGAPVTTRSYEGQWRLVFFGFTHCTTICPIGLRGMGEALAALGERAAELRALFITVDPARDDAANVSAHLEQYDSRIEGLVGSKEQIAAAMAAFRMEAHRIPTGGDDYQMDHPAVIFLMDPQGRFVLSRPSSADPDELADAIRGALAPR